MCLCVCHRQCVCVCVCAHLWGAAQTRGVCWEDLGAGGSRTGVRPWPHLTAPASFSGVLGSPPFPPPPLPSLEIREVLVLRVLEAVGVNRVGAAHPDPDRLSSEVCGVCGCVGVRVGMGCWRCWEFPTLAVQGDVVSFPG